MTCPSVKRLFTSNLLRGRELDSKLGCYSKSGGRRLHSKNELAIEQALNRVANSAATQALIKRGNAFLEAQAQQEAQEHVATRQALGMDVSAEVNTSRGPVMVMTLPEFAKGPMQCGPQGDGGAGGGGGGGGGG